MLPAVSLDAVPQAGPLAQALIEAAHYAPRFQDRPAVNAHRKLTPEQKVQVRRLFNSNVWKVKELAREFDVPERQIRDCVA